jgi:hypothetical protein
MAIILPERIRCFVSSRKFNFTAVACEDGMLRIRCNRSGLKIATVSIGEELAEWIIITKSWGFIIVKTKSTLSVWTRSGLLVNRCENQAIARNAIPLKDAIGRDFVAYVEEGKLWWFEAVYPDKLKSFELAVEVVSGLAYDWHGDVFVTLARDGTVRFYRPPGGL